MKFGVREICDVVFKAKADTKIGSTTFKKGQPVLYIDTAKTSTIEGAATTVYAQGGKGNTRLIAWEGEKTLTFTVEDALLSPIGFSILSGAGLFKDEAEEVHVHTTATAYVGTDGKIDLTDALAEEEQIDGTAPIFVVMTEDDGSITGEVLSDLTVEADGKSLTGGTTAAGKTVFVDFYVTKSSANVSELQIDAANFAGYYYVEASTLFRRQSDGVDMPAEITLPNVKIQSNFTFSMASTGDPSTFTFTMDAFPGYTMFDRTKQVLCVMQVIEDATSGTETRRSVMPHPTGFNIDEAQNDSTAEYGEADWSDQEGETEISPDILTIPEQTHTILNKPVSEMISEDTYVAEDGSVYGTLKTINGFTDFSSNPDEQNGYYFPLTLTQSGTTMSLIKNGVPSKEDITFDPEILLKIADQNAVWTIEVDDAEVVKLNFKNATFA